MSKTKCKKIKYKTIGKARHVANKMQEQHSVPYNFYFCEKCGHWHIGRHKKNKLMSYKTKNLKKRDAAIGIDPGITGSISIINGDNLEIYDFVNIETSYHLLKLLNKRFNVKFAILEKVWLNPDERDIKSAEVLIRNAQSWEDCLILNGIDYFKYSPATWRKGFIPKKYQSKPGYVKKAHELFPNFISIITRHDRAESSLIAYRAIEHVKSGMPTKL